MGEKPTDEQVTALADAMWQLLDDMGTNGQSVCLAAKAKARVAYEPFRWTDENGDDGLDMALAEAQVIVAEVYYPGHAALSPTETPDAG